MDFRATVNSRILAVVWLVVTSALPPVFADTQGSFTSQDTNIEEIVVTAQRKEERLLDVPMSIQAFTQENLDRQGLTSIDDITRVVPGVTFQRIGSSETSDYNDDNSSISIRGITSQAGYPVTGVYFDDTPIISRSGSSGGTPSAYPQLFDLERVEILKGPQGTLFGTGSMGGAIRFITPEASVTTYSGYAKAELGQIERGGQNYEIGAAFGGPIIDGVLGFRISASFREDGGWVDRVAYTPPSSALVTCTGCVTSQATLYSSVPTVRGITERNANWRDTDTLRAALKWQPIDGLTIDPSIYVQTRHLNDTSAYWQSISDPSNDRYYNGNQGRDASTDPWRVGAIKVTWALPYGTITSNTSYFSRDNHFVSDYSQWIPTLFFSNEFGGQGNPSDAVVADKQRNFTQEIRLSSADTKASLRWSAGVFYAHLLERTYSFIQSKQLSPVSPYLANNQEDATLDKQAAVFGEASLKLSDKWSLTGGLRYSKLDVLTSGDNIAITPYFGGPATQIISIPESSRPLTPRVVLKYQPDSDSLYYASTAKGFRTGVGQAPFSAGIVSVCGVQAPTNVPSDSLWQYELGSKNELFERDLQLSAAVYYYQWKNTQQTVYLPCGYSYTANLGTLIGKGAELTAAWRANHDLTIGLTAAYTDAVYEDINELTTVRNGDHSPSSPWNVDTYVDNVWRSVALEPYVRVDYQFATAQRSLIPYLDPGNAPNADPALTGLPEIRIMNLRAGIHLDGVDASLFIQNALDYHTATYEARDDATSPINGVSPTLTRTSTAADLRRGHSALPHFIDFSMPLKRLGHALTTAREIDHFGEQWSRRHFVGAGSAALVAMIAPSSRVIARHEKLGPLVETMGGRLRGTLLASGVQRFLGIPYGASTAMHRRFMPPQSAAGWTGVREATKWGSPCLQALDPPDVTAQQVPEKPSEDCLALNIWTPAGAIGNQLPVMVWLHGGGFEAMSANVRFFDGENLAKKGQVVVVSINHRLNLLGYVYLGGLSSSFNDSANTGQLDIVLALTWIRANIAKFGGDPDNVTLFGESGGGAKISTLLCMPVATGLFHKAIVQSGFALENYTLSQATDIASQIVELSGLRRNKVQQLRSWPSHQIAALIQRMSQKIRSPIEPVVDGKTLPLPTWSGSAPPTVRSIPTLIGTTHHEFVEMLLSKGLAATPKSDAELVTLLVAAPYYVKRFSRVEAETWVRGFRAAYPQATEADTLIGVLTWRRFTRDAIRQAEMIAAAGGRVFMYRYDWETPSFGGLYAGHETEVPLEFGNVDYVGELHETGGDDSPQTRAMADRAGERYRIADMVIAMWSEFARTGDPSTQFIRWPMYAPAQRATMLINATPRVVSDPDSAMRLAAS